MWAFVALVTALACLTWWWNRPYDGPDLVGWHDNYAEAVALAGGQGKPLLIDFMSEYCPPCRQMDRHVFSNPSVADAIRAGFVPVRIDINELDDHGEAAANHFRVQQVPTLVIADANGTPMARHVGYMPRTALLQWLEADGTSAIALRPSR